MTFKEKLQKEHPRAVSDKFVGGCSRCPSDYKYEKAVSFEACRTMYLTCEKCWNREVPAESEGEQMTIDEAIKHCNEVADGALCESTVNHKACGEELEDDEPQCPNCGEELSECYGQLYCPNCVKLYR